VFTHRFLQKPVAADTEADSSRTRSQPHPVFNERGAFREALQTGFIRNNVRQTLGTAATGFFVGLMGRILKEITIFLKFQELKLCCKLSKRRKKPSIFEKF
jgi:hypothetical protein